MRIGLFLFPIWSVKLAPLGLAYISAALRAENHDVTVRDYNLYVYNKIYGDNHPNDGFWHQLGNKKLEYTGDKGEELFHFLNPYAKEIAKSVASEKFDIIGISLYSSSVKFTEIFLRIIKVISPETIIIIGGPSSTRVDADIFLKHSLADYVVYGEGEKIICELVSKLEAGEDVTSVPSIKYMDKNSKLVTTRRKDPMTPDEILLPDFSDFDIQAYTYKAIPIMMSRGCVAACSFCNETHYWHRYRMGLIENIGKELESALNNYNLDFVFICDSLINGNHDLLEHLVDFVLEHKLKISWGSNARFDSRLTKSLLLKMKKAGCVVMTFGLESASQKVLKLMQKRITLDVVKKVMDDCEEVGIQVNVNILVGFPGEEEEDFLETIDFIRTHRKQLHIVNTGFGMEINENTGVFRQPEKYNILLDENGKIADYEGSWTTTNYSNTYTIRMERLRRLREILIKEKIKFREEKLYINEFGA